MKLGPIRHRGDLSRALDVAIEFGVDRVRQQLAAAGFVDADLLECLAAERKRLVAWRGQVEAEIGAGLPDVPRPDAA